MGIGLSVVLGVSVCVCLSLVFVLSCLHLAAGVSRKLGKVGQGCAVSEHFSLSSQINLGQFGSMHWFLSYKGVNCWSERWVHQQLVFLISYFLPNLNSLCNCTQWLFDFLKGSGSSAHLPYLLLPISSAFGGASVGKCAAISFCLWCIIHWLSFGLPLVSLWVLL